MKKQTMTVLIAALVFLQLYSVMKINTLQNQIENTNNKLSSIQNQMTDQINTLYQNVDEQLKAQASLIHSSSAELGEMDVAALTIPVTFTVEPKTVKEDMNISLDFDGEIVKLEQSGMKYTATKDFTLYESVSPKIIIDDSGTKMVEEHQGLTLWNVGSQIFPHIYAHFLGQTSYGSNTYRESGEVNIDYKSSVASNPFVEMRYVVKVDEETVKETPIPLAGADISDGAYELTLEIDESYPLNKGQTLSSRIVATDSLGFIHEYLMAQYIAGSNNQREPYFEQVEITAPSGETVYFFDEETGFTK